MKTFSLRAGILALGLAATLAHAGDAEVKARMEKFIGAPVVSSVSATPYAGLYEVVLQSGELVYVDEEVKYIFTGSIIEAGSRENLTQARKNELNAIDFATLPLEHAVKHVQGKGERVIATFEDPNCGFCKRLAQEIQNMDNVTVYTFLYPILSADSTTKSKQIWCSKKPGQAWMDWIADGIKPTGPTDCDTKAIDANIELGQQLRVGGTPTIFLSDGSRIGGYVSADKLEEAIAKAEANKK
ncbi:DsbC family protein [Nitrogeniibacter aestuarii]|uniref:DsbC family protein n=1 Tax=Nitrogeniibacter aestuarii TaxID=2815343 RepID=UPI001D121270|nr:DsbC family protein [Nitrogeniibacter aestuarii]